MVELLYGRSGSAEDSEDEDSWRLSPDWDIDVGVREPLPVPRPSLSGAAAATVDSIEREVLV